MPIKINNAFTNNYIEFQSNGYRDRTLSIKEYLDVIKKHSSNIVNDHKTQNEWEIQLTMEIVFISFKDSNETRTIHTTSDSIEIMIGNEKDEIIEERLESHLQKYQEGLKKSMKGSEFVFDSIDLLYYITNFVK